LISDQRCQLDRLEFFFSSLSHRRISFMQTSKVIYKFQLLKKILCNGFYLFSPKGNFSFLSGLSTIPQTVKIYCFPRKEIFHYPDHPLSLMIKIQKINFFNSTWSSNWPIDNNNNNNKIKCKKVLLNSGLVTRKYTRCVTSLWRSEVKAPRQGHQFRMVILNGLKRQEKTKT
jgi:hypothetical protein